jgi:LPXTG-site transpeptidase (sortase) family protein
MSQDPYRPSPDRSVLGQHDPAPLGDAGGLRNRKNLRRALSGLSVLMLLVAVGVLGYPFYTNLYQGRVQDNLEGQFATPELQEAYRNRTVAEGDVAGHRTTYGRPFHNLDRMKPGDEIILETPVGSCTYVLSKAPFVIEPTDFSVVSASPNGMVTLTTCHPKNSAAQRLIVQADLRA